MKKSLPKTLVIIDGVRTPFCRMSTDLAACDAVELGRSTVAALLTRTGLDPALVSEVVFGCVSSPADAANPERVIALRAGLPREIPAFTVQRNCASGLEALTTAATRARAGRGDIFIVGGTESMSQIPLLFSGPTQAKFTDLQRARGNLARLRSLARFRPSDFSPVVGLRLGLTDPVSGMNMGETAEVLAREFAVSREDQDAFALRSHLRAAAAADRHREEMVPVYRLDTGDAVFADNGLRHEQSGEALARLRPVFDRKTGTVTAGNSSQITDGAVALLVMTEDRAEELDLEPLGRLVDFAYTGCDPARMGLGPVTAIRKLAEHRDVRPDQVDHLEINEAFAAQVLAVCQALEEDGLAFDRERLNPNGGAIALGHPVGASGARLVLTSLHELRRTGGSKSIVSLCIGGGQGGAALLERCERKS